MVKIRPFMITFLIMQIVTYSKEIIPIFGQIEEVFLLFHNMNNGYYVNIGAINSIINCSTMSLYLKGWSGINIQAYHEKYRQYRSTKTSDLNLNIAIETENKYMTIQQYKDSQRLDLSKLGEATKNHNSNKTLGKFIVPAMTLKELCQIYYQKSPNFMNIQLQRHTLNAFLSNDWLNSKCRPEVIFVQKNKLSNFSQNNSPKAILQKNGYTQLNNSQIQIFIQSTVSKRYIQAYNQGKKLITNKNLVYMSSVVKKFYQKFYPQQFSTNIFNILNSSFFIFFSKQNSKIMLQKINKLSNKYSHQRNGKILVLGYNCKNSYFLAQKDSVKREEFILQNYTFTLLKVTNVDKQIFEVYVLSKIVRIQYIKSNLEELLQNQNIILEQKKNMIQKQRKARLKQKIQKYTLLLLLMLILSALLLIIFVIFYSHKKLTNFINKNPFENLYLKYQSEILQGQNIQND